MKNTHMQKTHQNDRNSTNSTNNRNNRRAQSFEERGGLPSTLRGVTGQGGTALIAIVLALALFSGMAGLSALGADDFTGNPAAQIEGAPIEGVIEVRFPSLNIEFDAPDSQAPSGSHATVQDGTTRAGATQAGTAPVILAGTLTIPRGQGDGPFPAVVLVSGSGLQNRDEEIMGHTPFKAIADYLAQRGIAVLRYDDRGFGQSTGDASAATTFDFTRDACGALEFLAKTDGIDAKRLGVIGHSEGGIVAAIIAAQQGQDLPKVSFIVMLAGPGVRGDELLLEQARAIAKASGVTIEQTEMATALNSKLYSIAIKETSIESRRQEIFELLKKEAPELESQAEGIAAQVLSPWVVQFLKLDPADYLRNITIPVLALNGTKDLQVPAASNLPAIDEALKEAGNTHYRLVALDGLNHLFQHAKTGLPNEYAQLQEDFAPEALALMGDWIRAVVDAR